MFYVVVDAIGLEMDFTLETTRNPWISLFGPWVPDHNEKMKWRKRTCILLGKTSAEKVVNFRALPGSGRGGYPSLNLLVLFHQVIVPKNWYIFYSKIRRFVCFLVFFVGKIIIITIIIIIGNFFLSYVQNIVLSSEKRAKFPEWGGEGASC